MANPTANALQRILPRSLWIHGAGRTLALWSITAALSLCALLVSMSLCADLLGTRGRITIGRDQAPLVRSMLDAEVLPELPADSADDSPVTFVDKGLLPAVIRSQGRGIWGPLLVALYRHVPATRNNVSALSLLVLVISVLGLLFSIAISRIRAASARIALQAASGRRKALHRQVLRLGVSDLTGDIQRTGMQLFLDTVEQIRTRVRDLCQTIVLAPVLVVLLSLVALSIDWRLSMQCIVPLAVCWWLVHYERSRGRVQRELSEARATSSMRSLAESLQKSRLVRGYSMEDFEQGKFETHLDQFARNIGTGNRREGFALWVSRVLMILFISLVLYMIALKVLSVEDQLPLYAAVLLMLVFFCLVVTVESLYRSQTVQRQISVAEDKVHRFLGQIPEVGQAVGAKFLDPVSRSITYESVAYRLNGLPLLNNLDLRIPARKSTALVSINPLEMRALAYMLPRFIEPHSGRVLFDSEDISWGTLESIRAETLYVAGTDPFFTGTVLENIVCGQAGFTLQEATEAAKQVHAHKFIVDLPLGYETTLGENGEQLDAGQAFRLGLARAAIRKPAVLIIEEPFAQLSDDTKSLLDDAYSRLMKDCTVILLPSRLSTVRRCDQVVFVHEGRVEAVGTHQELLTKSQLYRHWEYVTFNVYRKRLSDGTSQAAS